MKALFDTSVLISALYREHEFHPVAKPWLSAAKDGRVELVVAAHSLAEFFSNVTRLPRGWAVSSADAVQLLRNNVLGFARVRTLPATGYVRMLNRMLSLGLSGGVVYDGIIAEVARLQKVDVLVTLNPGDFLRVWPDDADTIIDPRTTQPPPVKTDS